MADQSSTTQLLLNASSGDPEAVDALWPHVYDELRGLAHARLRGYKPGDTLNTTGLVHEAYLRLVNQQGVGWEGRAHFFGLASRTMRFILVDYAREQSAQKRGGPNPNLRLSDFQAADDDSIAERAADLLTVDRALSRLAEFDERLSQLVEYRFFGGLTYEEIADVVDRSVPTVKRDWARARTWLFRAMSDGAQTSS